MQTVYKERKLKMLNSHDNPKCVICGYGRAIGFGTKLVNGRRTHITIYNCHREGKATCTPCEDAQKENRP